MANTRILSVAAEETATVQWPPRKRGCTTISRASYSDSSSSGSGSTSTGNTSIPEDELVDIPEVLNSRETLEFLGFVPEIADKIFQAWDKLQQGQGQLGYGDSIVREAKHYVRAMARRQDAWLPEHDWRRALQGMGVNQRLCDAILASAYANVRKTGSASYWVLDTIDIGWEFLEGLDNRIRKKRDQSGDSRNLTTPSPSLEPRRANRSSQPAVFGTYREPSVLRAATVVDIPSEVEGRTMLFKGVAMERLASVFNEDGTLNLTRLWSLPPTDFHRHRQTLLYFTKHLDVAETYARFAMQRVPAEEGPVLHFAVPTELLEEHREVFGRDWQQLVFWSRGPPGFATETAPSHLIQFTEAPLLIGSIYGMSNGSLARLQGSSDLTGQYLKTSNGGNASQHVFQSEDLQKKLQDECRGWVWYQSMRCRDFCEAVLADLNS